MEFQGRMCALLYYPVVSITPCAFKPSPYPGKLAKMCTLLYPAVVCAVTALQKLIVEGNLDAFGRNSEAGVLHIVWILAVDGVDAGDGDFLLAVRQIFDVAECLK